MERSTRSYALAAALAAGILVAALWAWNVLAELFSGPPAEFRHVLAAFVLFGILRVALSAIGRNRPARAGNPNAGEKA